MSLVECPSCGKDISPNATSCPGCGEPLIEDHETPHRVEVVTQKELETERSFNAWAYLIFWGVLFYITFNLYVPLYEMIFGKPENMPEYAK